jgi:DNA-binding NtrC family response regulator
MLLLLGSEWPGNVRELQKTVEHALAIGVGPMLTIVDLPPHINGLIGKMGSSKPVGGTCTLEEIERRHILRTIEEAGNRVRAAKILGIDRRTLYRKLDKYKVQKADTNHGKRGMIHETSFA